MATVTDAFDRAAPVRPEDAFDDPAAVRPEDAFDHPAAVRPEDAFDVAAAHAWLAAHVDGLATLPPPAVQQFPGGASNLTYLLRYPARDLVLRRPPAGHKAASAHDMGREFRVQRQLKGWYRYVPDVLALCDDPAVIGSVFYVMARVEGMILRRTIPVAVAPADAHALGLRIVDCLVELHRIDPAAAGLSDLGRGAGYVARQVAGWAERYRRARTPNVPEYEWLMAWLDDHRPADVATCLIHNDFRLDNLVLSADLNVLGVLDWEMATLGDPLMDVGGALAYWVQADDDEIFQQFRRQPSDHPGMPTRAELADHYCAQTGLVVPNWAFYQVFGLFRLAVIMQQIYYRYFHRQTTNPAFADFWILVAHLEDRCRALVS
ncbi:MAG TPA: phosphotransferase family protein [Acidimicrobiales bacterium]|nr:phosphotransferase family protein [Acidimicrobiales bacterium]